MNKISVGILKGRSFAADVASVAAAHTKLGCNVRLAQKALKK